MIYTSYYAKIKKLPEDVIPVSIAGKAPKGFKGIQYKKLAPKYSFFSVWKETHDNEYYIKHFNKEVLANLDIKQVISDLENFKKDENSKIALICYEKSEDFCHRHLVAYWLKCNGYECEEYREDIHG